MGFFMVCASMSSDKQMGFLHGWVKHGSPMVALSEGGGMGKRSDDDGRPQQSWRLLWLEQEQLHEWVTCHWRSEMTGVQSAVPPRESAEASGKPHFQTPPDTPMSYWLTLFHFS